HPPILSVPRHVPHPPRFHFPALTLPTLVTTLSLHDALPISKPRSTGPAIRGPRSPSSTSRRTVSISTPSTAAASRCWPRGAARTDRKSTRLNSSHVKISYAVFCLKKKTFDRLKVISDCFFPI